MILFSLDDFTNKMPENCVDCPMLMPICTAIADLPMEEWKTRRADGCKLVEIPPHGRLIDANKLKAPYDGTSLAGSWANVLIKTMIEDAPTVLPAEEGE